MEYHPETVVSAYEQLGLLADISVTLLGFVAVFLALAGKGIRFAESDRHFVQALVQSCLFATATSLIPRALSLIFIESDVWMYSLITAITFGAVFCTVQVRSQMSMSDEESGKIHTGWHIAAWSFVVLSSALLISGLIYSEQASALYVAAVVASVGLALFVFTGLIF